MNNNSFFTYTVITCETVRVRSGFYVHKMHVTIYVAISNTKRPTRTVSQVITVRVPHRIFI